MLLQPYRVLDLTREHGMLCAQILGDLGADVIQVEPPGGAPGRRRGPFLGGQPDPERSLDWWAYARGKRSIELDIDDPEGREILTRLIERADFLIESEPVGAMAARDLGHERLLEINPALIHVSMTPYGSTGPKSTWRATDLTLVAAAGPLAITGDDDRPPVRVSVPQAWAHAAAEAAAGALIALHERNASGRGQLVDVAAQQALTLATQSNILSAAVNESIPRRAAGGVKSGDVEIRLTYPAKDGHVSITHIFGATVGPATRRLMEYVYDCGFCDEATRDKNWVEYGMLLATGAEPQSEFERVKACVAACTASKTKAELLDAAMERRLLLAPIASIADVVESPHLRARGYFTRPSGDGPAAEILYPGPFAKFSATPLGPRPRPPRIGEHTDEVLAELERTAPIETTPGPAPEAPLAGVKVLDFMWALAGPGATRLMADFGATVVRVESTSRMDTIRTVAPFIDGDPAPEKSALFHNTNAGKRMITLDLTNPHAREVVLDLVHWADVVTESFTPRAMKAFGLDYESLRVIKPDLIMLSTCLMGQTGPLAMFAGYGNLAAAIAGFFAVTGWPDRPPAGPFGAYTDYIAPRFNAAAILAALDHRRRTGEGQHIDLAQAEAALHFLAPAILDYTANHNVWPRRGNADPEFAPHGVYPAAGEDRWVALACTNEGEWQALCEVIDGLDPTLSTAAARHAHGAEIDAAISAYTRVQAAEALERQLQGAGIPAAVVANSPECYADPQLQHLGHFIDLPHPEAGQTTIEAARVRLSRAKAIVDDSAPTFGRDLEAVLKGILGYDDERIADLVVSGALE